MACASSSFPVPVELLDQRLQRRLGVIKQHNSQSANHLSGSIAQRNPADQKGARPIGQQIDQNGLPGFQHVVHRKRSTNRTPIAEE
jgi:hypothetical protein